jgi:transposase
LSLMTLDAPQRAHDDLRDVFDALRWLVRTRAAWRYLPGDFSPWEAVYQQTQRWLKAEVFETMAHDLRELLRLTQKREKEPSAAILVRVAPRRDGRTVQSTPESGHRAGFDGHKRKRGSKVHAAIDTLGLLLAVVVTPANEQERAQVEQLASQVQEVTGENVEVAFVDQVYTGESAKAAAEKHGIKLVVVKHDQAKRGFVLLPRRWVVERSFAWTSRFRRLARDYERLAETLKGLHFLAFACLLLHRLLPLLALPASA